MTEYDNVTLGNNAAMVLDNPAYQLAMKQLKEQIVTQWENADVRDKEGQTLLLQMAKIAKMFEASLHGLINTGKFSQNKLDLAEAREKNGVQGWVKRVVNG